MGGAQWTGLSGESGQRLLSVELGLLSVGAVVPAQAITRLVDGQGMMIGNGGRSLSAFLQGALSL